MSEAMREIASKYLLIRETRSTIKSMICFKMVDEDSVLCESGELANSCRMKKFIN